MLKICLTNLLIPVAFVLGQNEGRVQTIFGPVKGVTFTVPGVSGNGIMFRSIRYAAPPTGEKRFAPPEDPEPWTSEYDASEFGPICPQYLEAFNLGEDTYFKFDIALWTSFPTSEDCLTLDVYTPSLEGSRTVMVFIHGGGFGFGNSRYEGRSLSLDKDVVVVSIQYRLGYLGWASTGDDAIKGNFGFMDQILALKWVKNNIAKFGGNPNDVTLYGESAGAMSISMHIISPKSKGLFKRAILMSGSLIESGILSPLKDMPGKTIEMAGNLGCGNKSSSQELLACLQGIDDSQTIAAFTVLFVSFPVIDGDFIPDNPTSLIQQGKFNDVDILAGSTTYEGFIITRTMAPWAFSSPFNITGFKKVAQMALMEEHPQIISDPNRLQKLTELLADEYAKNLKDDELRVAVAEMVGDLQLTQQTYKTVVYLEEKSAKNFYFYEWQYGPSFMQRPAYMTVDHADDVYLMGSTKTGYINGVHYDQFTQEDKQMDDIMLTYWSNFAKTGNPNGGDLPTWPSFKEDGSYIKLNPNPTAHKGFKAKRMKFWTETFPKALQETDSANINIPSRYIYLTVASLGMLLWKVL